MSVSIKSGAQLNENAVLLKKARNLGEDKAECLKWKSPRLNSVLQKINTTEEKWGVVIQCCETGRST